MAEKEQQGNACEAESIQIVGGSQVSDMYIRQRIEEFVDDKVWQVVTIKRAFGIPAPYSTIQRRCVGLHWDIGARGILFVDVPVVMSRKPAFKGTRGLHAGCELLDGKPVVDRLEVETPRMRNGENAAARVPTEAVLVFVAMKPISFGGFR